MRLLSFELALGLRQSSFNTYASVEQEMDVPKSRRAGCGTAVYFIATLSHTNIPFSRSNDAYLRVTHPLSK